MLMNNNQVLVRNIHGLLLKQNLIILLKTFSYIRTVSKQLSFINIFLNISQQFITCFSPSSALNASYPGFVIWHLRSVSFPSLLMLLATNSPQS